MGTATGQKFRLHFSILICIIHLYFNLCVLTFLLSLFYRIAVNPLFKRYNCFYAFLSYLYFPFYFIIFVSNRIRQPPF